MFGPVDVINLNMICLNEYKTDNAEFQSRNRFNGRSIQDLHPDEMPGGDKTERAIKSAENKVRDIRFDMP